MTSAASLPVRGSYTRKGSGDAPQGVLALRAEYTTVARRHAGDHQRTGAVLRRPVSSWRAVRCRMASRSRVWRECRFRSRS